MRIEVKNLSFIYNKGLPYETKALSDVSFIAEEGDFVALIGCTGSGKTTLAEQISGLAEPSEGEVLADGLSVHAKTKESKEKKHRIGIVFQYPEYQLFEETVLKDVMYGPINMGLSEDEAAARAEEALRLVGLDPEDVRDSSPFSLSGGQKRRVAIAGVLAMQPKVLILDEPTAGLDPKGHNDILDMIRKIKQEKGMTVFLVSHNMEDVAALATKVIVLKNGSIEMTGSPREVFSDKEKIRAAGLSLPFSASFAAGLSERGLNVNSDVLTIEEAADEIAKALK